MWVVVVDDDGVLMLVLAMFRFGVAALLLPSSLLLFALALPGLFDDMGIGADICRSIAPQPSSPLDYRGSTIV